jgi:hypothetical protein
MNPGDWVREVLVRLQAAFGSRLLYLGLQGSRRRGDAGEMSDRVVNLEEFDARCDEQI